MQKTTKSTKVSDISRRWYLVDAKDKILGRVAVEAAKYLIGKYKPYYVRNMDCGDYVVVINAKHVRVTGKKEKQKLYSRYSGYPGGLKQIALWQMRQQHPEEIIRHAVKGMLPKNKLQKGMISRLEVYPDQTHPHAKQFATA